MIIRGYGMGKVSINRVLNIHANRQECGICLLKW